MENKIGFTIVLIVDLELTKSANLSLGYSYITNIILKVLVSFIKL